MPGQLKSSINKKESYSISEIISKKQEKKNDNSIIKVYTEVYFV